MPPSPGTGAERSRHGRAVNCGCQDAFTRCGPPAGKSLSLASIRPTQRRSHIRHDGARGAVESGRKLSSFWRSFGIRRPGIIRRGDGDEIVQIDRLVVNKVPLLDHVGDLHRAENYFQFIATALHVAGLYPRSARWRKQSCLPGFRWHGGIGVEDHVSPSDPGRGSLCRRVP